MRRTAIALSAFALALTLGACGDKGGDAKGTGNSNGGAGEGVVAANLAELAGKVGDKTEELNSAHFTFTGDVDGQSLTGEGDMQVSGEAVKMKMDMSTPQGDMAMVLVDDVLYVQTPEEIEPGKSWIKIDGSSDNPLAQALGSMTEELKKNADPRAALDQLKDAGEITDSSSEDLDGIKTTHYKITVDVQKMADAQTDPTMKAGLEAAIKQGLKDFPVDVWVDEKELPVRIKMDMPLPNPATGEVAENKIQMDYSKWGEPVDVVAPPAEQVAELPTS